MDLPKALAHLCPGASWSLAGDTYEGITWHDAVQPKPTREALEAAWQQIMPSKGWPDIQQFMRVFTDAEKAAVSLSRDATIAALRIDMSTWLTSVKIQDERVQRGLSRMVELGIIDSARKAEIEAQAS